MMDEMYDTTGAAISYVWGGLPNPPVAPFPYTYIANSVHVFPDHACFTSHSVWADADGDGFTDRAQVRICADESPWLAHAAPGSGGLSYSAAFLHELMHTTNFGEPGDCPGDPHYRSVLGVPQNHLFKEDINALQFLYGLRWDKLGRSKYSTDQLTWTTGPVAPAGFEQALSRLSACDNLVSSNTFISYVVDSIREIRVTKWNIAGWTNATSSWLPASGLTQYHTGIACKDASNLRVFFLSNYVDATGLQDISYFSSANGGGSWAGPTVLATCPVPCPPTDTPGLDATYDPASSKYIVASRTPADEITVQVDGGDRLAYSSTGAEGCGTSSCIRSADTPSIACGNPTFVGAENCIISWSDTDWYRTLKWSHGHVVNSCAPVGLPCFKFSTVSGIRNQGYIVFGTPSVAYVNTGSTPWQIAFHQGGWTTYVFRKAVSQTASWTDQRSFVFGNRITNPTLGSYTAGGTARVVSFTTSN